MAGPTPQRAWTGSGCRNASSSPGATTTTPGPGSMPAGPAFGLAAFDASLATSLVVATPTEHVSWRSSLTRWRMAAAMVAPSPNSRMAPLTSRKASSRAMPSTSGVNEWKMAWTALLASS